MPGFNPRNSHSVGLGWGPGICVVRKLPQVILMNSSVWKKKQTLQQILQLSLGRGGEQLNIGSNLI